MTFLTHAALAGEAGSFTIAHMAHTPAAIDYAIESGANAVEGDLRFDARGEPFQFRHGWPCDCICFVGGVCKHLVDGCQSSTEAARLLRHMASKKTLALVVIDSKVDPGDQLRHSGSRVVPFIDKHLFANGYQGNVVISIASSSALDYLDAAKSAASMSTNANNYYFSIDEEGRDTVGTLQKLTELSPRRLYAMGRSSCYFREFHDEIKLGALNRRAGVVGAVYTWTIDSMNSMRAYIEDGADGIITNYPARLASTIQDLGIKTAKAGSRIPSASSEQVVRVGACPVGRRSASTPEGSC